MPAKVTIEAGDTRVAVSLDNGGHYAFIAPGQTRTVEVHAELVRMMEVPETKETSL